MKKTRDELNASKNAAYHDSALRDMSKLQALFREYWPDQPEPPLSDFYTLAVRVHLIRSKGGPKSAKVSPQFKKLASYSRKLIEELKLQTSARRAELDGYGLLETFAIEQFGADGFLEHLEKTASHLSVLLDLIKSGRENPTLGLANEVNRIGRFSEPFPAHPKENDAITSFTRAVLDLCGVRAEQSSVQDMLRDRFDRRRPGKPKQEDAKPAKKQKGAKAA